MTTPAPGGRPPLQPQLGRDQKAIAKDVDTIKRSLSKGGSITLVSPGAMSFGVSSPQGVGWWLDRGILWLQGQLVLSSGHSQIFPPGTLLHRPAVGHYSPKLQLHDLAGNVHLAQVGTDGSLSLLSAVGSSTTLVLDGANAALLASG